jgi:hypothetical protein
MFRNYYKTILIFIIANIFLKDILAQKDSSWNKQSTSKMNMFSSGLGVQHGFIFAHSQAVQNTKGSHPTGIEAIFSWQRNDASIWALCNCYPRTGLLLAYYDYNNAILGKSFTTAYFLEPVYRLNKNIHFSFKGAAGLSYLTNPFDSLQNPTNLSYSTTINPYLLLGLGLWLRLDKHWWLNTSVNYQHQSNGGLKEPNKGINWPTAGLALSYQQKARQYYTGMVTKQKFWKTYSIRWDVGLFGMAKRALDKNGNSSRLPLLGLFFQGSKQVGRLSALTAGTEIYRDAALRVKLKIDSIKASPVKAGVSLGHEFILGKFLFSQRLGLYIFDKTPYYDKLYHRWGIHYRINQSFGTGFNLQAHRHIADFVDLKFTYTI